MSKPEENLDVGLMLCWTNWLAMGSDTELYMKVHLGKCQSSILSTPFPYCLSSEVTRFLNIRIIVPFFFFAEISRCMYSFSYSLFSYMKGNTLSLPLSPFLCVCVDIYVYTHPHTHPHTYKLDPVERVFLTSYFWVFLLWMGFLLRDRFFQYQWK